jgi:hypothetical protein
MHACTRSYCFNWTQLTFIFRRRLRAPHNDVTMTICSRRPSILTVLGVQSTAERDNKSFDDRWLPSRCPTPRRLIKTAAATVLLIPLLLLSFNNTMSKKYNTHLRTNTTTHRTPLSIDLRNTVIAWRAVVR